MAHTHKQLGQSRPSATTAASIYSPGANIETTIRGIFVCNTSLNAAKYSIYCDDDGTTYDESTALFFQIELPAKSTIVLEVFVAMNDSSGNLAVQTDSASALTFTVFGAEVDV